MQTEVAAASTFVHEAYKVREWKHAETILVHQFPDAYADVINVLASFRLYSSDILVSGGSKSPMSKGIETPLSYLGWKRQEFNLRLLVNDHPRFSQVRSIDHCKGRVALEIEWNSKASFFDRDLDNFRLLFQLDLISVGIIITRSDSLQAIFKDLRATRKLKSTKYGTTTTQMSKLMQKIEAGGGAGCPILVFGISEKLYVNESEEAI